MPQVVEALRSTQGMVYLAAQRLGVAPVTVYAYANRYSTIRDVIEEERGRMVDMGEVALKRAVLDGQGWAIAFLLKTLGKNRGYYERQEVINTGEPQTNVVELKWSDDIAEGRKIENDRPVAELTSGTDGSGS